MTPDQSDQADLPVAAPIVVLGFPRSGTTWVANALAAAVGGGHYVHEPFNLDRDPAFEPLGLQRDLDATQRATVERVLDDALAAGPAHPHPVVKDVHALFALAALARERGWPTIVVVRHPCAVATSWSELGWQQPGLDRLLRQPGLVAGPLAPFADHLRACRGDLASSIGATWGATHLVLRDVAPSTSEWISYEQVCADPAGQLLGVLGRLGVETDAAGEAYLRAWLDTHDRDGEEQMNIYRVAAAQPGRWRTDLAPEPTRQVLDAVAPFAAVGLLALVGETA